MLHSLSLRQSSLPISILREIPSEEVSINAQLLTRAGYIRRLMAGVYTFLPFGNRVLTKIENIVREEMNCLGGLEVLMPALQPRAPWDATGRWETVNVLFKLKGAGDKDLTLGPTHEEVVTPLLKEFISSYRNLPVAVYQIQTKFRNEARPKSGLLRGREFRMKDLYSFHRDVSCLDKYYERVKDSYMKIFERMGIGNITYLTYASGGTFSKYSHEFQTVTEHGEDSIFFCSKCSIGVNKEIFADLDCKCPECRGTSLEEKKTIEVGNIFKLMDKFSQAFNLTYSDEAQKTHTALMGCYGLGTSRVMGAIVEALSDKHGIVWPKEVAPYKFHLVSLARSPEEVKEVEELYQAMIDAELEVLYDDRADLRPGEKFVESDLLGMPIRVVMGPKTFGTGKVELKWRGTGKTELVSKEVLLGGKL